MLKRMCDEWLDRRPLSQQTESADDMAAATAAATTNTPVTTELWRVQWRRALALANSLFTLHARLVTLLPLGLAACLRLGATLTPHIIASCGSLATALDDTQSSSAREWRRWCVLLYDTYFLLHPGETAKRQVPATLLTPIQIATSLQGINLNHTFYVLFIVVDFFSVCFLFC